jgi:hypothetical protein
MVCLVYHVLVRLILGARHIGQLAGGGYGCNYSWPLHGGSRVQKNSFEFC